MTQQIIELVNISKDFDGNTVLKDLNLYIRRNEFLTLLGPSGCGKTTTLRIIGGFEFPTSGSIFFEGNDISHLPPYQRKVNTVFQNYALFPHMNVAENIAFGLRVKKVDKKVIKQKVEDILFLVNLAGYENRAISSLSGGQQQRVAIARALVNEPDVLLLDEPLGALDLKQRKSMQIELKKMQKRLGITFIYVTHDQEEALTMSDTVVVMKKGEIQQIGTPVDIYNEPRNAFVANFIGESNIVSGVMLKDYLVYFAGHEFECVDKGFENNSEVEIVIRPEDIQLVNYGDSKLNGEVEAVTFKGVHYEMNVRTGEIEWTVHSTGMAPVGSKVGLEILPDAIHVMEKGNQE